MLKVHIHSSILRPSVGLGTRKQVIPRASPGSPLVRANVALGYPPLSLNLTGLDADPEQVAELLLKEWLLRHQAAVT
jgi:hypothetical protein